MEEVAEDGLGWAVDRKVEGPAAYWRLGGGLASRRREVER